MEVVMITFIKADFAKALLSRVANDNDTKTTILGLAAGALLAANLNWGLLFKGDSGELGKAAGAVIAVLIGYYTNKPNRKAEA
jgi:hypothetical protein